jgi:hypothetical protein
MSASDVGLFAGQLVSAWVAGFAAGYVLTRFREAMNHAV